MDVLSQISWVQNTKARSSQGHFEDPEALVEVYACPEKAISSLSLESSPTQMTVMD